MVSQDPEVAKALGLLKGWDNNESTSSVAAAIYEVWATKHLGRATVGRATPEAARKLVGDGQLDAVISYLEHPDSALGADPSGGAQCDPAREPEIRASRIETAPGAKHGYVGLGQAASRDL